MVNPKWILLSFLISGFTAQSQVYIADSAELKASGASFDLHAGKFNFIVMGDWGRNGADHQKEVAAQMGKSATAIKSQFVIAVGDNFYPSGVISEMDPLFHYSFENIYTDFSLQWDWYVILGNHDYKSNPDAQVKYSQISRRWKMPARYYSKKIAFNGNPNEQLLIAFIDTNPLIPQFYSNSEYGPNVKTQDSTAQKQWLEQVLGDSAPEIKWKIVVGHHPMYTGGGRTEGYDTRVIRSTLKPILDKYAVDAYVSGHEHSLQHIKPAGKTHHFISGSASEKTPVKMIDDAKMVASEYGFMVFSIDGKQLWMQTVDYNGNVIYKTSIHK
jgi:tartrate-resistant acid phosphatase type 5